ncbi:uncharacterized protein PV09_01132 [Verruconis gallopava]|uniref:Uncharacterized protein n=1 Tax=Verruconis gallopava TaxID=253628 RepID=A0A0D1Z5E0_9PEZI|nr:uncharacterized protein PV09_01132 [Verruconis gallopava]KIW08202.1 hypothetical protein PV09_01132 [Verruconis gallopava]
MVVIRESPNAKEPKDQPQWPPRSPHEALLSSPSGRKRLERIREGRSVSPSPRRPIRATPKKAMSIESSSDEEEDEDEETLQLKLKAIEAKLKLKKLQKAKKEAGARRVDVGEKSPVASSASGQAGISAKRESAEASKPDIEVPLSPVKKQIQASEPKSPARILLGIDKGIKAQDVSLKRPRTTSSDAGAGRSNSLRNVQDKSDLRVKSFSERIAESRLNAQEQQAKEQRIIESRSKGFGLHKADENMLGDSRPRYGLNNDGHAGSAAGQSSTTNMSVARSLQRSSSLREKSSIRNHIASGISKTEPMSDSSDSKPPSRPSSSLRAAEISSHTSLPSSEIDSSQSAAVLEPYSGVYLKRRDIDHSTLTRTLQGKELYPIPRLLHEIKGPSYDAPDCESDYVVFGVICSKSTPRDHKNYPKSIDSSGKEDHARPKFMVFRLTDFKYEVDLFLFDTGFERWWKLKEGTLIAVLNPGIMPPRVRDTGAFSLKVTSSEDTVLEIGRSRDLGVCKAMKSDGSQCTAWVDKRKTEVCEYHISLQVDKARAERMQFSTMTGGRRAAGTGRGGNFGMNHTVGIDQKNSKYVRNFRSLAPEGKYHNTNLHETMWITPKEMGLNTASLLDKEYTDEMMNKEARRKRQRDKEKEEELAKSLGLKGNGTGSEYLKHRNSLKESRDRRVIVNASSQDHATAVPSVAPETLDAASLGLLGKTAQQVSLSPVKRKFKLSTENSRSGPLGWSGAFTRGLLQKAATSQEEMSKKETSMSPRKSSMKAAQDDTSPRKKARLLLDGKGVRIPGRESLGAAPGDAFLEDDDDDLEIV